MTGGTIAGVDVLGGQRAQHATVLEALDAEQMAPLLAAALGDDPRTPCLVVDAKYEPGRRATVLYRLGASLVHAVVPAPGEVAAGWLLPNGIGVRRFPHDPGLPTLPDVLDPERMGAWLGRALDLPGGCSVGVRLLRYRPGRRATVAVTVRGSGGADAMYVAKVYHDGAKAAAVTAEGRALNALRLPPPLVLAPVVAHLPELAVVVQGHLPGRELALDLADPFVVRRHEPDLVRAAQALAALHGGHVPAGRPRPLDRELDRFVDRATAVCSVDPSTGEELLALARDLLDRQPQAGPLSLVHGDCKPSQFLVDGDRVAVLDLDHCGIAEPAYDVGNFVASLRQAAIRADVADGASGGAEQEAGWEAARAAEALGATFVTAYVDRARPSRPDELTDRIGYYVGVSLLRKALRAWSRSPGALQPGRLVAEARRAAADLGSPYGRD